MSHRKLLSQGSIPFSWEETPGVTKVSQQHCPIDASLQALEFGPPPSRPPFRPVTGLLECKTKVCSHIEKIHTLYPLQAVQRSSSARALNAGIHSLNYEFLPPPPPQLRDKPLKNLEIKIPPPPCQLQGPRKSISTKGIRCQEDPFLVAYMECTRSAEREESKHEEKKSSEKKRPSLCKSLFSCKYSCEVRDDSVVNLLEHHPPFQK